jgi:hypothetical protein
MNGGIKMPITKKPAFKVVLMTCIISLFILGIHIANGALADPGTDSDPIVAKSYVDEKVGVLQQQIQQLTTGSGSGGSQYTILQNLKSGQKILTGENTEIIVRVGTSKALKGEMGRLVDLTSDTAGDLLEGMIVPLNHLVLSARNDGRGIIVETDGSVVVVRGLYTLN